MLTRREAVASLAFSAAVLTGSTKQLLADSPESQSLAELAAKSSRLYGCASATGELDVSGFAPVLRREARILVAEYEMKRSVLEPEPGAYNFSSSDRLLHFARASGMAFRGHTLVWHKSNPAWLEPALSAPQRQALLTGYIESVMRRYRGQLHSWDVVNEALAPEDGRMDGLRDTIWLRAFGPSYIAEAFHAARAADPDAVLVYNDWGCEGSGPKHDRFRAATLDFLGNAKARGIPIDAYGMQGHLQAFGPAVDQRKLREFLERLKALGLQVLVTEHDVDDSGGPLDILQRDRAVADASRRFLDVALDCPATIAVLTWGLSDRFLDPPGWKQRLSGYAPRLLPLDADFRRKPMWTAMAGAFAGARPRLTGINRTPGAPLRLSKFVKT